MYLAQANKYPLRKDISERKACRCCDAPSCVELFLCKRVLGCISSMQKHTPCKTSNMEFLSCLNESRFLRKALREWRLEHPFRHRLVYIYHPCKSVMHKCQSTTCIPKTTKSNNNSPFTTCILYLEHSQVFPCSIQPSMAQRYRRYYNACPA